MSDLFYRDFEDCFRGSRELIRSRLGVYLPFARPLAAAGRSARALDLGCGRGEWLELLGENGFDAFGVDLDEGMLAACRERGLQAQAADAFKTLQALPADSLALVSAFHVVEHLPFEVVRALVQEALRVLAPGGLLILETPNSENLAVGTSSFYLDPSHLRPLPAALLDFVAARAGFCRSKVLYLQEAADLHAGASIGLISVLSGVSPDYALVAQKSAPPGLLAEFDAPFHAEYGLSLEALAQRYDRQADQRSAHIEERLAQADQRSAQLENGAAQITERLSQVQAQLQGMLNSRSWRITAPMRWLAGAVRSARQRLAQFFSTTP